MKDFLRISVVGIVALTPFAVFAQTEGVEGALEAIGGIINLATPIVVAIALLAFFWGLVTYIFKSGSPDERKKGLSIMIWGIIALFVMLSVFGIINALQDTFGVKTGNVNIPSITTDSSGGGTGNQ